MIDIFLSRPTWIEEQFDPGLQGFLTALKNLELNSRHLVYQIIPTKHTWMKLLN
jgi:hypothetical protein